MTQPPNQPPGGWAQPDQPPGSQPQYGQWPQPVPGQHGYPAQSPPAGAPGYGQQPQFGGGFASQYGGLGAFEPSPPPKRARSKKPYLIGGTVIVVLAAAAIVAWLLGAFRGDVLDKVSLQDGVTTVLSENFGEQDVRNAQCPENQEIKNGNTFECSVDVAGQPKKVTIRVLNDKPEFEVGAPK